MENFDNSIPNGFPVESLFDGDALAVRGFSYMQPVDRVSQFFYAGHAVASTKSPTLQNVFSTPAAIAGGHLKVLCRLTKL